MWSWQVVFYDPVSDRSFLVSSVKYFRTPKEAEDDIVRCCNEGAFTQRGIPLSSQIHTAETVYFNFGGRNGQDD